MANKWRWKEGNYDKFWRCCLGMTNAHIFYHPLRALHADPYKAYKNRLYTIGEETKTKRRLTQQKYCNKRRCRRNMQFRTPSDAETAAPGDYYDK